LIKTAVILIAGFGSRLMPLTETTPKCMVQVKGKPILVNTLDTLEKNGIKEVILVVGHLADVIKSSIGNKYRGMDVKYITSEEYKTTNSMYSLWLAKDYLKKGSLIIEGDSCSEEGLIKKALNLDEDRSYWVLDTFTEKYDGSMSTSDDEGKIVELEVLRETEEINKRLEDKSKKRWKSCGIVKVTPSYGEKLAEWLDKDVEAGNVNLYYDLVIAKHLEEIPLYVCDVTGMKWFEIDNFDDLKEAETIFKSGFGMKYVIVIGDGMADLPIEELNGKTPLEVADTQNLNYITKNGKTGLIKTMYPGLPVGSIVANMALLGFDPREYYPNGRASFEALAQDIFLGENDIAFRCNLISTSDGKIKDFTSGFIENETALNMIDNLDIKEENVEIYAGQSYRNTLVLRDAKFSAQDVKAFEPHMNVGKEFKEIMLQGMEDKSKEEVNVLNKLMLDSIERINELNKKFDSKADMVWLWSPSSTPKLPSFKSKYGMNGAIVAGLDFMRGIGMASGMDSKEIKGATGYLDTNLKEKLKYAKNFLRNNDLVYVHINAPDEESHGHNVQNKIKAIERIDKEMIGPLKEFLDEEYKDNYRIVVLPDHYTLLSDGTHRDDPVPFVIFGKDVDMDSVESFNESEIKGEFIKGHEFMNLLLQKEIK
jgi:2,3-bisphosphoglycerate-independent phosphoglycerate mutase